MFTFFETAKGISTNTLRIIANKFGQERARSRNFIQMLSTNFSEMFELFWAKV